MVRIMALGLLVVSLSAAFGIRRTAILWGLILVSLAVTCLSCRWRLGDAEMTWGQSISVTQLMAAVCVLGMWWVGLL